ncbi:hypothetical protein LCGC14_1741030 [marine sediment metagenome]|uniref:Uncharacterized protein n=1 Tax=marine sediment metagenome TaxID=412755 RepID=A0A0F9H6P1_9ZZZZ
MEYTKGEWEVKQSGTAIMANGKRIATIRENIERTEREANARLIAAAPLLYDALRRLLEDSEIDTTTPDVPARTLVRATPSEEAILQGFFVLAEAEGK